MTDTNCDAAPVKERMKEQLSGIAGQIQRSLAAIDNEDYCLLREFEGIRQSFKQIEAMAASFYLQCYLSSFTTDYVDLSVTIRHLSERRHGALIVVERNDPLEAMLHSGIAIDSTLTYSLLEAIFYPGNPLHDGAVLIKGDRIVSAANVLPVSHIAKPGKKLGTRHRAAIGLSERTDALVLVVSEETGQASFAFRGFLHPVNAFDAPVPADGGPVSPGLHLV
ncbi:sporulation-specific diadenylate cyclase CdaS [Paenibacillus humicola]|uniref:sporulation-specific diadenylate cyclase CdaS n=1 Tax=Paenibacillus humicola TaxID=3110540 RepID=UPI00237B110E|nr:sporulation-specific diadenylate cyclase CdaS [Paenibacillus humicola]